VVYLYMERLRVRFRHIFAPPLAPADQFPPLEVRQPAE
jgi:hypothetical protein